MGFRDQLGGNVGNGAKRSYFKAREYAGAYAILIETKEFKKDQRNPFYNAEDPNPKKRDPKFATRDEVIADLTVFKSPEDLKAGVAEVLKGILITDWALVQDLEKSVDKPEIARIEGQKINGAIQNSWFWRPIPDDSVIDQVGAYYDNREAEIAAALSGDDLPDWAK